MYIALTLIGVLVLVIVSAVCSGLNVALMALNVPSLRRKAKLGNAYAKRILPLRTKIHLSLASILLTNVAVISASSLLLGSLLNGLVAGILSTLLIVIFGEVLPQAIFSKHALVFSARLAFMLRLMILVTYPVSKPLELLLDRLLGDDDTDPLHSRQELGIIIAEHQKHKGSELDEDEIEIIRGALSLSEKKVSDILTDISNVFWLTPDTVIEVAVLDKIKQHNWSRIPVLNRRQTRCFGIILMKDLVDIDFEKKEFRVSDLPLYPVTTVGMRTALDTLFRRFISAKSHLMAVERADKIVGIVTVEDLLEQIIGHAIEDESDRMDKQQPSETL